MSTGNFFDKKKEVLKQIAEKYSFALADDFFQLLNIDVDSSPDQVKASFFRLARVFHPDVINRLNLDKREFEKGKFIFKKLSEAYNTLTDTQRRSKYILNMKGSGVEQKKSKRSQDEDAEIFYHKSQILLRRNQLDEAETFLKKALEIRKEEPRYLLDLGWIIFRDKKREQKRRIEEARKYYEKAMTHGSNNARAHYYLALYYKAKDDIDNMYNELRDALSINPKFTDARRELRLLRIRMKKKHQLEKNPFYKLFSLFKKHK